MVYTYTFTAATPNFRCINPEAINSDGYNNIANIDFEQTYQPTKEECNSQQKHLSLNECQRCFIRSSSRNQSKASQPLEKCEKYVYDREHYTKTLVEEVKYSFLLKRKF